jgi:prolyl oligopeptidase
VIEAMARARDALYLRTMVGGVDRLERVPIGLLGAKAPEYVRTPFDMAISQLVAAPGADGAILRLQGWIEPPMVAQVDKRGDARRLPLQPAWPADFGAMDEVRLYAPAADGTRVPITLVYRKSTQLDGRNPTLLTVYGAYGETVSPVFEAARLAWLERGGVLAIAHVRGGGEYGEPWHQAGRGAAKANTIGDTLVAAEFLVSYRFTQPRRLAIEARGAGAIAAGVALARRPDLFAAAVLRAPLADMLRYEQGADGAASVPEFGSAATPAGAEALRALSSYHQVKDATPYPAVLVAVGAHDARVDPWHAAKLAARLQAATPGGKPVLLRVDAAAGHEAPTRAQREEELADVYAFVLWQMGEPTFAAGPEGPTADVAPAQAGAQSPTPDEFVGPPEPAGPPEPPPTAR